MRRTLAVLLLVLAVPALAGDGDDPTALARCYLSSDPAVRAEAERVVAVAPAERLRLLLAALRAARAREPGERDEEAPSADARIVRVDVRFLDVTTAAATALGLVDGHGEILARGLSSEERERVLLAAGKGEGVVVLASPRLAVHDRQKADVTVTTETSFLADVDVEVAQGGRRIADPVIGSLATGVRLSATPRIAPDASEVLLDLDLELSELVKPIEEHVLDVDGTEVRIQLPEVRHARLQRRVAVADGGTVVVGTWSRPPVRGAGAAARERRVIALVTAQIL